MRRFRHEFPSISIPIYYYVMYTIQVYNENIGRQSIRDSAPRFDFEMMPHR